MEIIDELVTLERILNGESILRENGEEIVDFAQVNDDDDDSIYFKEWIRAYNSTTYLWRL